MDQEEIEKPELGYRYEFGTHELDEMSSCLDAHGFAVIKDVLSDEIVTGLREAVWVGTDPDRTLEPGKSRTRHAWVESGPGAWSLLENEAFITIHRHLIGADDLTVHRSAAIIRMPGSAPISWHTDWAGFNEGPPQNSGDVLNAGMWPSGKWFYITGSHPMHGGLSVIEDSHVEGWEGPEGFKMTAGNKSFYPEGEEEKPYTSHHVPGLVPLFTNPGDMIVFAHRTYHWAFGNKTDDVRLSCAIGFRDRNHKIDIPWEIPEAGRKFMADLPEHLQKYLDGYTSIDVGWKRQ